MLLIVGGVIVLVAAAMILEIRVRRGGNAGNLGSMGEEWLAKQRASTSE